MKEMQWKKWMLLLITTFFITLTAAQALAQFSCSGDDDFCDDFNDNSVSDWSITSPEGQTKRYPNTGGGIAWGVGTGYNDAYEPWSFIFKDVDISASGGFDLEIRAVSAPSWPNAVTVYLYADDDSKYVFQIYGESSNYNLDWNRITSTNQETNYRYHIGPGTLENWHTYRFSRDGQGNYKLYIDGQELTAFTPPREETYTHFKKVGIQIARVGSKVDYITINDDSRTCQGDSDSGKNYYQKGEACGYREGESQETCVFDACSGDMLTEQFVEDCTLKSIEQQCNYKCENGACMVADDFDCDSDDDFCDDFNDNSASDWSITGPTGQTNRYPTTGDGIAWGVGTGYSPAYEPWAFIFKNADIPASGGFDLEIRAVSAPSWPNAVSVYLYTDDNSYYFFRIYGESSNYKIDWYRGTSAGQQTEYRYHIGPGTLENWHTYKLSRDTDGNYKLYIDGQRISAFNPPQEETYTRFRKVGVQIARTGSRTDYIRMNGYTETTEIPVPPLCLGNERVSIKDALRLNNNRLAVDFEMQPGITQDSQIRVSTKQSGTTTACPLLRNICSAASGGASRCTAETDCAYPGNDGKVTVREEKCGASDSFTIAAPQENPVELSIRPEKETIGYGDSATYTITIKDNHPDTCPDPFCDGDDEYTYSIRISNLPFQKEFPRKVTLKPGEKRAVSLVVNPYEVISEKETDAFTVKKYGQDYLASPSPYHLRRYEFQVRATLDQDPAVKDSANAVLIIKPTRPTNPPEFPNELIGINLHKGWNLISLPGNLVRFEQDPNLQRRLLGYVYLKEGQRYATMKEAQRVLGAGFKSYLAKNAFWAYSFTEHTLNVRIEREVSFDEMNLNKGWNLVPVTEDMAGGYLNDLKGDCVFSTMYLWDAAEQAWQKIKDTYVFADTDISSGILIKAKDFCSMVGVTVTKLEPPIMPE